MDSVMGVSVIGVARGPGAARVIAVARGARGASASVVAGWCAKCGGGSVAWGRSLRACIGCFPSLRRPASERGVRSGRGCPARPVRC